MAGHKTQRHGVEAQGAQHVGDVDALAAELEFLGYVAVDLAGAQVFKVHHIVDCGVEGYGVNHAVLPPSKLRRLRAGCVFSTALLGFVSVCRRKS